MDPLKGVEIATVAWRDNTTVSLVSTFVGEQPKTSVKRFDRQQRKTIQIDCPKYNKHMGGVDLLDSFIGHYKNTLRRVVF